MIRVLKLIENEARRREEVQRVEAERRQRIEVNNARLVAVLLPLLPSAEDGAKYTFQFSESLHISGVGHSGLSVQVTCRKGQWVLREHPNPEWWDELLEYLLADVPE